MKTHPSSNPIALVLNTARAVLVIIIALLASLPAMAQQGPVIVGGRVTPIKVTIPRALMQVQPAPTADDAKTVPEGEPLPTAVPPRHQPIFDPVFQLPRKKSAQTFGPLGLGEAVSAPIVNVLGMLSSSNPPDTTGDVGPNHYIQMVNATRFQIFNKAGAPLTAPITFGTLWTPATTNTGDPIVVYDHLADRWVLTQFFTGGMYFAVSQTPDPTAGTWYLYTFNTAAGLPDYPKVTVWPDGYYMSTYESPSHGIHAFERAQMLVGAPAGFVKTTVSVLTPSAGVRDTRILPADLDGVAPPVGTPCYFLRTVDGQQDTSNPVDRIQIYEAQVNWAGPTINFPLVNTITPAAFNIMVGNRNGGGIRDMIPQPNTTATVDGLSNRPMMQLKYRLIGGVPRMVVCQTIDISGSIQPLLGFTPAKEVAGIRWYQLEKPAANWTIGQQGTFGDQPPGATNESQLLHRWIGSAAMNGAGDIAIGYSICNDDDTNPIFPGIRYTGRLAGDTPGTMPQGEGIIVTGTASKGANGSFGNRWGDYAQMGVDPTDDNTFWYTSHVASGQTHIASFQILPNTPAVTAPTSVSTTATDVTLGGNVTSQGSSAVTERGVVYALTSVNGNPVIGGTGVTTVTSPGTTGVFTVDISGLTTGAGYSFKAYATNSVGTGYTTPVSTFTQGTPTVTTPTSAGITANSATLGGNVTDDVGSAIIERGVVFSVSSVNADPVIGGTGVTKLTSVGSTGVFTVNASGLSSATGYAFKAYATNAAGTTYTTPVSTFTTLAVAPTVTTPTQTAITSSSATLGGNVTSNGGAAITERGIVYSVTTVNGNPLIGGTGVTKITGTGTTGIFTVNVTGLSQNTGYSFKAYAINSTGTTYTAPVSTFTTPAAFVPTVTTPTQTNITAFAATLGGNVTSDGGAAITERGVVYSATTVNGNPLIGGTGVTKVTGTGTTGIFTVNVTGLSQNTGYSFKAYATNSIGTTYTAPVSTFTTAAAFVPTVTTPTQTAITARSATLGGNVTSDGGAAITERGIVYSITTVNANPIVGGTGVTKITSVGTTGVFTVYISALAQNTGYSFKAYAINSIGTGYTTPVSTFSTPVAVPLTGTKTVGSGGNYTSLTNAGGLFDVINGNGVNGAVNIQITSNLTAETGTVALNAMSGTTPSLKIFPTGAARTVSGTIAGALIRLNGADNVTFDGSLGGTGTDRSLTMTNTSTASPTVLALISLGTGLGATNNVIKNCNISTGVATSIGYGISVGGSTPGTTGADNDNVTIQNNAITAAPTGIYASGTASASTGGDDNLQIIGNSITYNSTLTSIGIRVGNARTSSVSQNTVSEQTTASGASTAISIETGFVSSSVTRNTVTKSLTTNTGGWGSRGITVGTGTATSALTIANNIIFGVNGSNWSSFNNTSSMGIAIGTIGNSTTLTTTTGGINLYYNSVHMTGSMGTASSTAITAAIYIGSGASALDMRNNIFANTQVGTNAAQKNYAIYSAATSAAFTTINYNDYFVSNTFNAASAIPGFLTSDRINLAGIQAGFGQNTQSFVGDPLFTSVTDLHVTSLSSPVSNTGTPIATVLVDFDGGTRSATTPDIGADEFGATPFPTVTTPTQIAITATNATLGGNVTNDGGTAILERGVVYSVTAVNNNPLIGGTGVSKVTGPGNLGVFTVNATGLVAGTGYSFKAYAINAAGTAYTSPVSTFTTLTAQEAWRLTYFGITTNTGNAADTADPDGDGGNNLFEFVAGLVPNDPLSRFSVRIEAVALEPMKKAIIFRPLVPGRTYVVKRKISLTDPTWVTLTDILTSDNVPLLERTVTDNTAGSGAKFYQVEITLPP